MAWASMAISIDCSSIADHYDPLVCQKYNLLPGVLPVNSLGPSICRAAPAGSRDW